jgi:dodecin
MPESVYDVIELVGTSKESWEKAATDVGERASKSLRELRVAEIVELDMQLDAKGQVEAYRAEGQIIVQSRALKSLRVGRRASSAGAGKLVPSDFPTVLIGAIIRHAACRPAPGKRSLLLRCAPQASAAR